MNQSEKAKMMRYIQELGFAIDDVVLYLDTHPKDQDAFMYYEKYKKMYKEARKEYTKYFGPLVNENVNVEDGCWSWVEGPWPWEGGC